MSRLVPYAEFDSVSESLNWHDVHPASKKAMEVFQQKIEKIIPADGGFDVAVLKTNFRLYPEDIEALAESGQLESIGLISSGIDKGKISICFVHK